jgi:hypothetical protein
MDVDPTTREPGYRPSGTGLGTIDEEDLPEFDTPPGTPFDSNYPPQQTRGYTEPNEGVHTENFFTPLHTDSQETDHTNINNAQPPTTTGTPDTGTTTTAATGAAHTEIPTSVADTVAEAHQLGTDPPAPVAETVGTAAADPAVDLATEEASGAMAAQAARPEVERTETEEAAMQEDSQTATEDAAAAAAADETARAAETVRQSAAAAAEERHRQEAAAAAAAAVAKAKAAAAAAAAKGKGKKGKGAQKGKTTGRNPGAATNIAQQALNTALPPSLDDWELSEGDLPEGATLSGSKALMHDYPEDEASSKQTKKTDTGKDKGGNPTPTA